MRRRLAILCVTLGAAGVSTSLLAHHSISMVDIGNPVWVQGTVTDFHFASPHVMFTLEVQGADGRKEQMRVEGPNLARMERMGAGADFLKAGDKIEACGFHLKAPYTKPDFIHAEVLVMPDGHMRHYGPYGKLENCLRAGDSADKWVNFLHEDPLALPAWCDSHKYVHVANVAPSGLVEEIDRKLGNPCPRN
jgi:hypothetical protein